MFPHFQYPAYGFPPFPGQQVHTKTEYLDRLSIFFPPEKNIENLSPTGFWLFHASLWLPSAEEHCTVAPQQRSAFGEGHTEATAPPAGKMREYSFRLLNSKISADFWISKIFTTKGSFKLSVRFLFFVVGLFHLDVYE